MTQWHSPDETPPVKRGNEKAYIIAVRRAHNGKVTSFPALYLNTLELQYNDGQCPHCPGGDKCRIDQGYDGCPVTGWFDWTLSDDCDGRQYEPVLTKGDKIEGWTEVPQWEPPMTSPVETQAGQGADGENK
jgi:hypothetical protein